MSFFTFGGKLILYDYESIPLVSNTIWAYVRPRLLASNSSLYTTHIFTNFLLGGILKSFQPRYIFFIMKKLAFVFLIGDYGTEHLV